MIIYYVGAHISLDSQFLLWRHFGTVPKHLHATIVYSRTWFSYRPGKFYPLIIEPPYKSEVLNGIHVMSFFNQRLFERHAELRDAGASWDYDTFQSHISIGVRGVHYTLPDFPITLSNEYYQTWEGD